MEKLQFITNRASHCTIEQSVERVLRGGCRWVQLRMKEAPDAEFLRVACSVRRITAKYGATFIIDDRVDMVPMTGADGVHLGKNDMPVIEARGILGREKVIGATANTFADIEKAVADGADYVGLGPFRFTSTKKNLSPILGIEGYDAIMSRCRKNGIVIPVVAIGGIEPDDIESIMATGVSGIALSGTILRSPDPEILTTQIITQLNNL